jgi:hypothetical protein
LTFLVAGRQCHAFLLDRNRSTHWVVRRPEALWTATATLLREMGNYDASRELTLKELDSQQWKKTSEQVLAAILEGSQADFKTAFKELVIVPDGILWYVPFEALHTTVDGKSQPLLHRFRIRYAPTLGLAIADARPRSNKPRTSIVLGKMFPKETEETIRAAYDDIASKVPDAVAIDKPLAGGSTINKFRLGHLVVLDDLAVNTSYTWSPVQSERSKGGTLYDWIGLPWGGPDLLALPGYHTLAENPRKGTPNGTEVFLSMCGLMATGARTALVSRWKTGGQSSLDLTREFVQELPHTTPADAWQRAVLVLNDTRLNIPAEPRLKITTGGEDLKADHPFFWAGYMLVDRGDPVRWKAQPEEKGTEGKPKKPAAKKPGEDEPPVGAEDDPDAKPDDATPKKPAKPGTAKPDEEAKPEDAAPDDAMPDDPPAAKKSKPEAKPEKVEPEGAKSKAAAPDEAMPKDDPPDAAAEEEEPAAKADDGTPPAKKPAAKTSSSRKKPAPKKGR